MRVWRARRLLGSRVPGTFGEALRGTDPKLLNLEGFGVEYRVLGLVYRPSTLNP